MRRSARRLRPGPARTTLTPLTLTVEVSDALKHVKGRKVNVTVVPIEPHADGPRISDALSFESVRIVTYESTITSQTPPPPPS